MEGEDGIDAEGNTIEKMPLDQKSQVKPEAEPQE